MDNKGVSFEVYKEDLINLCKSIGKAFNPSPVSKPDMPDLFINDGYINDEQYCTYPQCNCSKDMSCHKPF